MIPLFHITDHIIDTSDFTNLLHDKIVEKFTSDFCEYVGAGYGCPVHSASNAIFLLSLYSSEFNLGRFRIPSVIPPVVLNSVINGGQEYEFVDDVHWVGHAYTMHDQPRVIDSAQEVRRNQCANMAHDDITIFSFYPTKPVGSVDGGMIVSHNKDIIDFFKIMVMNGMQFATANWNRKIVRTGWKMYMNSIQAYIANKNLTTLEQRQLRLAEIRELYNCELNYNNSSDHLYRINVHNNVKFIEYMSAHDIVCGIHYHPCHMNPLYRKDTVPLPKSELATTTTVSIPYHASLSDAEVFEVIKCTRESGMVI